LDSYSGNSELCFKVRYFFFPLLTLVIFIWNIIVSDFKTLGLIFVIKVSYTSYGGYDVAMLLSAYFHKFSWIAYMKILTYFIFCCKSSLYINTYVINTYRQYAIRA
jgi:hypothetical protein